MASARSRPALRLAGASASRSRRSDRRVPVPAQVAATTRAKYRQTLAAVEDELGEAPGTGPDLAGVVEQRWQHASPRTWNRHVATVRSFARYCERTRILEIGGDVELQRRAEKHDCQAGQPVESEADAARPAGWARLRRVAEDSHASSSSGRRRSAAKPLQA